MSKHNIFSIILLGLSLIALEFCSYILSEYVLRPYGVFYFPEDGPLYSSIEENWHPEFGWPSLQALGPPTRDASGARHNPYFTSTDNPCISVYGESATYGAGVPDEAAWSNLLSKKMSCRISNFGVSGHGLDQALLRFKKNTFDRSSIVIMGAPPSVITRHINQFRPLLPHNRRARGVLGQVALKPRFILNGNNQLVEIPLPLDQLTEENYAAINNHPEKYLTNEYYQVGGDNGPVRRSFPYTVSLLQLFKSSVFRSQLLGDLWYAELYDKEHPSKALPLTSKLFITFHDLAIAQGRQPLIVLFPAAESLNDARDGKGWVNQSLMDRLDAEGVAYIHLGDEILKLIGERDACDIFVENCIPHLNAEGTAMVTDIIYSYLTDHSEKYPITKHR